MKSIYIAVIAIAALGLGFFGGMKYSQKQRNSNRQNFAGVQNGSGGGRFGGGGRQFSFRPVAGEIVSQDEKSITVKLEDGQSKIILVSDKTQINKAAVGSKTDLLKGEQVAVFGSENSDGTVTAQNIQLNPQLGRFRNTTPAPTDDR